MYYLIVIIPILLYIFIAIALTLYQRNFVFKPGKTIFKTPKDIGLEYDNVFIELIKNCDTEKKSDKGFDYIIGDSNIVNDQEIETFNKSSNTINCWFIPVDKPKATIFICHGNSGTMSHRIDTAELFHSLDMNVMLFDYRGFGLSKGRLTEQSTYDDAEAVLRYLRDIKKIPITDTIILGRSMGGPIAAKLAKENTPLLTILESTFSSIPDIAKFRFPILPAKRLVTIKYPTIDFVKKIKSPIMVTHSKEDEVIPFFMGENIYKAAPNPKYFYERIGSHNDTYFDDKISYINNLKEVLEKTTKK